MEHLLIELKVPADRLDEGATEGGATADVLTASRVIDEAGGLVIAAHANSTHGVALRGLGFGGQTRIAFTQDRHLHALEVTDLEKRGHRTTVWFFSGRKPEYPRRMHCIQGSDAHRLNRHPRDRNRPGWGDRVTEILLPEPSFEAIKAVFLGDDFSRTRPYRPAKAPFDHVQAAREEGPSIVQSFHESMTKQGGRLLSSFHEGLDIANKMWTPVVATADGVISLVGMRGDYGISIMIDHYGGAYTTVYAHLEDVTVEEGQVVRRNECIGYLGNTGRSTGPHLHYEVRKLDRHTNPRYFLLPSDAIIN